MIQEFHDAVKDFDASMTEVFHSEEERLCEQRKYLAVLATNSGKPADYFVLPSFLKHSEAEMSRDRIRKVVEQRIK